MNNELRSAEYQRLHRRCTRLAGSLCVAGGGKLVLGVLHGHAVAGLFSCAFGFEVVEVGGKRLNPTPPADPGAHGLRLRNGRRWWECPRPTDT